MTLIKRELLQNIAIFGGLTEDALGFLLQRTTEIRCGRGEFVFREGAPAQSIYILEQGRLAVLKQWEGGQYLLGHLEAGACFGEMALMDMHPRSASVLAVAEVGAFKISAATLLELYHHDLEQFTLLQMNLGREVSRRLREADQRMFHWRMSPGALSELPVFPEFNGV